MHALQTVLPLSLYNMCLMYNYRVYNNLFRIFLIQMENPSTKHVYWYKFYYFENIKINNGCCFQIGVFRVLGSPSFPAQGKGPRVPRIPKWEKLQFCHNIKIILYNFVTIFIKPF